MFSCVHASHVVELAQPWPFRSAISELTCDSPALIALPWAQLVGLTETLKGSSRPGHKGRCKGMGEFAVTFWSTLIQQQVKNPLRHIYFC